MTFDQRFQAAAAGDEAALLAFFDPGQAEDALTPDQLTTLVTATVTHRRHAAVQLLAAFLQLPDAAATLGPIFEELAAREEPAALYVLGFALLAGPRHDAGVRLLEQAGTAGYVPAKHLLGDLLFRGVATGKREAMRGSRLVEEAMAQGFAPAAELMATWQGDPEALFQLGLAHLNGDDTPVNLEDGLAMLADAARRDFGPAQDALAQAVLAGMITPNDPRVFASLLGGGLARVRQAAEAGDREAQALLGFMLVDGHGTAPDPTAGGRWLQQAAAAGNAAARSALG